jgi:hypothetical protein
VWMSGAGVGHTPCAGCPSTYLTALTPSLPNSLAAAAATLPQGVRHAR